MLHKYKSKFMAALLSLMMVLGVLVSPFAGASATSTDSVNASGSLDIRIPRNGSDANKTDEHRQMVYFKISENEMSAEELQKASIKYDAMSIADIQKELNQEGVSTELSKSEPAENPTHEVMEVRGVAPGAYIFKETVASANAHEYKIIAIAWNAQGGATSKANAKTKKPNSPLILKKIAYEKGNPISLAGVKFELRKENEDKAITVSRSAEGKYVYDANSTNVEMITNNEGIIEVDSLPEGKYFFRETQALEGYELNDKIRDTETVTYSPAKATTITKTNSKPTTKGTPTFIALKKIDGETRANLKGVKFKLYVNSDGVRTPVGYNDENELDIGTQYDHTFETNAEGTIYLENLPELSPGATYEFKEVQALEGYALTDTFYTAKRKETITVENHKKTTPLNLTLNKTDGITGAPIDKVGFELYRVRPSENANDRTLTTTTERVALTGSNGSYKFEENILQADQVFQLYTDTNGKISVTGLPDGEYYFRENEPARGYNLAENRGKESERLSRAKTTTTLRNRPITPPNVSPPTPTEPNGGYRFVKVDDSEEQKRLAGALFAVYKVGDNGVASPYEANGRRMTVRSGENGEFELTNLPYGKYVLRETAAPAGHVLDVNPIEFTVSATSYQEEARMIVNKRTPDRPSVPPVVSPPTTTPPTTTTPPRQTVPPVVNPPSTTPPRQSVPPVVSPPGTTYYVPSDTPGIPRGPLVKTGDIRIVILVALGILMIIGGSVLVKKGEKDQGLLLA